VREREFEVSGRFLDNRGSVETEELDSLDVRSNLVPCLLVGSSNDLGSHRPEGGLLLERHLRERKETRSGLMHRVDERT